jgi:hypothetical protein
LTSRWRRIGSELQRLLDWWLGELRDSGHAALAHLFPRRADRVWLYIEAGKARIRWTSKGAEHEAGPVELDQLPNALADARRGTRTRIQLDLSRVLLRDIVVPDLPERELADIVALQAERVLPLKTDALYVDWRIKTRMPEQHRLVITVAAMKRRELDALRGKVSGAGLRVDAIQAGEGAGFNFSGLWLWSATVGWNRTDRLLALSFTCLMLFWGGLVVSRMLYERDRIGALVADEHAKAGPARLLQHRIEERIEPMERIERLMTTPTATDLVATLTEAIPSDTWVYSAEVSGNPGVTVQGMKIAGFTPTATLLVQRLAKNPALRSVRLVRSTSGGIGIDRFEIAAQLSAPAERTP